jgi:hypothetical protein
VDDPPVGDNDLALSLETRFMPMLVESSGQAAREAMELIVESAPHASRLARSDLGWDPGWRSEGDDRQI